MLEHRYSTRTIGSPLAVCLLIGCQSPLYMGSDSERTWLSLDSEFSTEGSSETTTERIQLRGSMMMGYQGWFGCPDDGSQLDGWMHWSAGSDPTPETVDFDAWPDLDELSEEERCATDFQFADGEPAYLFSSYNAETVARHTRWMSEYGIDGVFLQRFNSELISPPHLDFRDQVTRNIQAGSEEYGTAFAIMYDISGAEPTTLVADLIADWKHLVDDLGILDSPAYLHHGALPAVGVWGFGFTDRPGEAEELLTLLDFFQQSGDERYRAAVIGGVPSQWRSLSGDSRTDAEWTDAYLSFDVISPWSVGRYADTPGADNFRRDRIEPDLAVTSAAGVDYMPVIFPGFSWANLVDGAELNAIPRDGGQFYWHQAYNAVASGSEMLYTAMFDEVDESTAMFKLAASRDELPATGEFLALDADGHDLPSDWYLQVAGEAAAMLRDEVALTDTLPISWEGAEDETTETTETGSTTEPDPDPPTDTAAWHSWVIAHAYTGILGRDVDEVGASGYLSVLEDGSLSIEDLCDALWSSDEFATNRATLSSEALATSLYEGILERAPDTEGLASTTAAIEEGRGPERAADMLQSGESQALFEM